MSGGGEDEHDRQANTGRGPPGVQGAHTEGSCAARHDDGAQHDVERDHENRLLLFGPHRPDGVSSPGWEWFRGRNTGMTTRRVRVTVALAVLVIILLATHEGGSGAYSNILPTDYVGPGECRRCHEDKYSLWRTHPHSRMNANASEQTVLGDFSGKTIEYDGGSVVFDRVEGRFTMTLSRAGNVHRFVVTRTI